MGVRHGKVIWGWSEGERDRVRIYRSGVLRVKESARIREGGVLGMVMRG